MITVEKCLFINRAPFKDNLEITFQKDINVLCGINGRGKTTIISYIVDAIYEMAKLNYQGSFEGRENKYYRVSSSLHSIDPSKPSIVYIRFNTSGKVFDYIDVRGVISEAEYNELVKYDGKIEFGKIQNGLKSSNTVKLFSLGSTDTAIKDAFTENVLTYFPSYRYELPGYLNDAYKNDVEINNTIQFTGELPNPIEVCTGLDEFSSWILDVVLDWEVNKQTQKVQNRNGIIEVDLTPEKVLWNNLSDMMKRILTSKNYPGIVRFGIGRRSKSGNRISVMHDNNNHSEQICPNLSLLSSGETALMCLFGEIIRQADNLRNNVFLNQIEGIVLIDEVEKHLHIRLQKEALPQLMNLFPRVQFIVSSHSPFLNMGLSDECSESAHIFDLDNGGVMTTPTNNDVYQDTYELFLNEKNRFATEYEKVNEQLKSLTRPVVITEGKTDIKHILKAMQKLGIEKQFDTLPEAEQPDGDTNLKSLIKNLCLYKQPRKVIAVFDRDNDPVTKEITDPYRDYGNNVYALRIVCPQCRIDEGRTAISIEHLYSDNEIHTVLPNGCQLFFGNEFENDSTRRHVTNPDLRLNTKDGLGKDKIVENNGGQAVYDKDFNNHLAKKEEFVEAIVNDQIEISQESWENFRPTIDMINQIIGLP